MEDNKFVLEVSDLHTTFKTDNGDVSAVNGVSFKLEPGRVSKAVWTYVLSGLCILQTC